MPKQSAGLAMYRRGAGETEVLLVHPGGPFWAQKNEGAWTIPKGEVMPGEELLRAAQREFQEETGFLATGPFHSLGSIRQASGKIVSAWAFAGECDPRLLKSNLCQIEWPPRSKRFIDVPEVDRGAWFTLSAAPRYILKSQQPLLERLHQLESSARHSTSETDASQ